MTRVRRTLTFTEEQYPWAPDPDSVRRMVDLFGYGANRRSVFMDVGEGEGFTIVYEADE